MILHDVQARPTSISGVIAVTARSARGFARHTHDQFGIGLVEGGAQTSASGRGQVWVKAGDLITVNPGEVHDGLPMDDRGRAWRMLYLDPEAMAGLTGRQEEFAFPVLRQPGLAERFRRLFRAVRDPAQGLATEAELVVLSAALDDRPNRPAPPAGVTRALEALQDDPARPVSLADLAAMAGLTQFHFLRSFAKATGLTPHAFQMQARLHLARRLIASGQPLSAAAAEAGFADQSHLTRLFSRSYGMSPGRYGRNFVQDRGRASRG
ncbi:AraC family ligand binding domain-containing protein [Tabrizicola sp.]|uniref:AraC family ligand binding domain-containing protein n=1 Tax=Tabrizicola sp. TaxID=2005166 RepID=UPI003F319F73